MLAAVRLYFTLLLFAIFENFDLLVAVEEKSEDAQSPNSSSSENHKCPHQIYWQSIL